MHGSPGIASTHPQGEGPLRTPFYFEVIRAQGGYLVLVSKWPAEPTLELASLVLAVDHCAFPGPSFQFVLGSRGPGELAGCCRDTETTIPEDSLAKITGRRAVGHPETMWGYRRDRHAEEKA